MSDLYSLSPGSFLQQSSEKVLTAEQTLLWNKLYNSTYPRLKYTLLIKNLTVFLWLEKNLWCLPVQFSASLSWMICQKRALLGAAKT